MIMRWATFLLLPVCLLCSSDAGTLTNFTARGRITYTNYLIAAEHYTIDYIVYAKPPLWKIAAHQFGERGFGYTEHGYDGKSLYSITYYNKDPIAEARANTNLSFFVNGKIVSGEIPPFDPVRAIHIWFAYLGLQDATEQKLSAVGCKLTSGRQVSKCYRTIISVTNIDPTLGIAAVSGEVRDAGYDYDVDGNATRLPPPLDHGYTPLVFNLIYADRHHQGVPTRYAFTARIPMTGVAAGKLTDIWTLTGETTSIENGVEIEDFRPEIIDRAYVWDYVNHIEYMTKSGWVSPGSPSFDNLKEQRRAEQHSSTRRILVLWCFAGLFISPIIFLLVRQFRIQKS